MQVGIAARRAARRYPALIVPLPAKACARRLDDPDLIVGLGDSAAGAPSLGLHPGIRRRQDRQNHKQSSE